MSHLYDLLIGHTCQEDVLLVLIRMEADDVWYLSVTESFQALPSLGVPELHRPVVTARQELATIVRK